MNKKIILILTFFFVFPAVAKHQPPQDINEGTVAAGTLGGLLVGGVVAAASRSPYGLLAAPAGALIGVLIKRHRNKKRMENQNVSQTNQQRNYNYQNQ